MTSRAFRDAVARQNIPHVKLGARVVVAVEDLRALARHKPADERPDVSGELPREHDDHPATADAMLAELGFARRSA